VPVWGNEVVGESSLITMPTFGWKTFSQGARSRIAKPEPRAERKEMAVMRVSFMVGKR